jgi:hypothetical protein
MGDGIRRGRHALRQGRVYEQTLAPGPFKCRQAPEQASVGRDAATGRLVSLKTLRQRFEEKCAPDPETGCWTWQANKDKDGYAMLWHGKRNIRASHAALLLVGKTVPKGMYACHSCDNPKCVNPDHLFVCTPKENQQDSLGKGRRDLRATDGEKHPSHKLTAEQVRHIRSSDERGTDLAARYGVNKSLITAIRKGRKWAHV